MSKCDFCDSAECHEVVYDDMVSAGRKRLALSSLKKTECLSCGESYVTEAQMEHNHGLYDAALAKTPEAVAIGQLRTLRCRWELTQRSASSLFGAGENAFAKWESGQLPSGPAALLIQCATNVTGVIEYLAHLRGATLPGCPEFAEWHSADGNVTGVAPIYRPTITAAPARVPVLSAASQNLRYEKGVVDLRKVA